MFEKKIGYRFSNKLHLKNILIHTSYAVSDFQLYEFLGDRILGLVIADLCFKKHKKLNNLSTAFVNIVNTDSLANIVKTWNIEPEFKHSINIMSNKVYADIFEATVAGIYLDSNYNKVYEFIENIYNNFWENNIIKIDPKILLQEYAQKLNLKLPIYKVINEKGKDHEKQYIIEVTLESSKKEIWKSIGKGNSKIEASKNAAENLLKNLK